MCRRQRVRDTERQLASLQTALAEQHKQHERQSAQLSNEADAKVQLVKVLQEQAFELQRRVTAQRCKFEATLLHSHLVPCDSHALHAADGNVSTL